MFRLLYILFLILLFPFVIFSQKIDSSFHKENHFILIDDMQLQIEINEALDQMYDFKFESAEQKFRWLKQKYSWHPLPYFLMGLSEWWKIMPNYSNTVYDEKFLSYMDTVIYISKKLEKKKTHQLESYFFLAVANGFKGMFYSLKEKNYFLKAIFSGKKAIYNLQNIRETYYLSDELIIGEALYNYYSVTIGEKHSLLRPIIAFFPKGDKMKGIELLKKSAYNAFYTRTEAMLFLMRILANDLNQDDDALQLSAYLHNKYPDNPYFHRYYAKILFKVRDFYNTIIVSESILEKIDNNIVGYDLNSERYASFYLGKIHEIQRNRDKANHYFSKVIDSTISLEKFDSIYFHYALAFSVKYCIENEAFQQAKTNFKLLKKHTKRNSEFYLQAKKYVKEIG